MSEGKKKYRLLNQIYAFLKRRFWLPCPLCGDEFGGHEKHGHLAIDPGKGQLTCEDCIGEADKLSEKILATYGTRSVKQ